MSDFLREVDEDYRNEQMVAFWKRNGWIFLLIAGVLILGVAIYTFYSDAQDKERNAQSTAYQRAEQRFLAGREDEAIADLKAFLDTGPNPGYQALAALRLAQFLGDQGKAAQADTLYEQVATNQEFPDALRALALYSQASRNHARLSSDELKAKLAPLEQNGDFQHLAAELIAASLIREGADDEAYVYLRRVRQASDAPQSLRARAETLLSAAEEEILPDVSGAVIEDVSPDGENGSQGDGVQ